MYQRILVPVDGSETAAAGLAEALRLAQQTNARLHIVHVVDLRPAATGYDVSIGYTGKVIELQQASGKVLLKDAPGEAERAGVKCDTQLLETCAAPVSELILAETRASKTDVVVLGTHGCRGIRRALMGSDAEQVLRQSDVPVPLVRARPVVQRQAA